jgi:hypothetical protein
MLDEVWRLGSAIGSEGIDLALQRWQSVVGWDDRSKLREKVVGMIGGVSRVLQWEGDVVDQRLLQSDSMDERLAGDERVWEQVEAWGDPMEEESTPGRGGWWFKRSERDDNLVMVVWLKVVVVVWHLVGVETTGWFNRSERGDNLVMVVWLKVVVVVWHLVGVATTGWFNRSERDDNLVVFFVWHKVVEGLFCFFSIIVFVLFIIVIVKTSWCLGGCR